MPPKKIWVQVINTDKDVDRCALSTVWPKPINAFWNEEELAWVNPEQGVAAVKLGIDLGTSSPKDLVATIASKTYQECVSLTKEAFRVMQHLGDGWSMNCDQESPFEQTESVRLNGSEGSSRMLKRYRVWLKGDYEPVSYYFDAATAKEAVDTFLQQLNYQPNRPNIKVCVREIKPVQYFTVPQKVSKKSPKMGQKTKTYRVWLEYLAEPVNKGFEALTPRQAVESYLQRRTPLTKTETVCVMEIKPIETFKARISIRYEMVA